MAITFNDNFKINVGKPVDSKYLNAGATYADVAEVNSTINISERYIGLTVNINNVEYWYKDGVTNSDLVKKFTEFSGSSTLAGNGLSISGTSVILGGTLSGDTCVDSNGYGIVFGGSSTATGADSHAEGFLTNAFGANSHSEGLQTYACGDQSHAEGNYTSSIGYFSHSEGNSTNAFGIASHSEGLQTYACGDQSHAEGRNTRAIGTGSHSEGCSTNACGGTSHSEGCATIASGYSSHAEGRNTRAIGSGSHSEGSFTCSIGNSSHSEGRETYACGDHSHSEGFCSYAIGNSSHAQGKYTCASGNYSHVGGQGNYDYYSYSSKHIIADGENSFNHSYNNSSQTVGHGALAPRSAILGGINHNIESYNTNATIIGGNTIKLTGSTYVDTTAVGCLAIFETPSAEASGCILAWNPTTKKIGIGSGGGGVSSACNGLTLSGSSVILGGTLSGDTCVDSNGYGIVFGTNNSQAIGANSFTGGYYSCADGDTSFAFGNSSCATGLGSFAVGLGTTASGSGSHAEGCSTTASGNYGSHAEGYGTTASGSGSHAEGYYNTASGKYSHVEGSYSTACGYHSHSEGFFSYAIGSASHAEGKYTCASGNYSHAQGDRTKATGITSFSSGRGFIGGKDIIAGGSYSFNHSRNDVNQTAGHGALADNSSILGGLNHNIEVGNTGSTIIGGNTIKLTGTTYIDTTAAGCLAIFETPSAEASGCILAWNPITKKIGLTSVGACNGLSISGTSVILGGTLSGDTCVDSNGYGIVFGTNNSQAIGDNSLAEGYATSACGANSHSEGCFTYANGNNSHAEGGSTRAYGNNSHAEGNYTYANVNNTHVEGQYTRAYGYGSHVEGCGNSTYGYFSHAQNENTLACGRGSHVGGIGTTSYRISASGDSSFNHSTNDINQTAGYGANANQSAILGGLNHNITISNTGATILGGYNISLTGSSYVDTTAVGCLAIFETPSAEASGCILAWNPTTKKIGLTSGEVYSITGVSAVTLTTNQYVVIADSSVTIQTINLPATPQDGQAFKIKDNGNALTNNITVSGNGKNIDGAANATINTNYGGIEVVYSSTDDEWYILSEVT